MLAASPFSLPGTKIFPELAQVSLLAGLKLYRSVTGCAARFYHAVFYIQRNIKSIAFVYV